MATALIESLREILIKKTQSIIPLRIGSVSIRYKKSLLLETQCWIQWTATPDEGLWKATICDDQGVDYVQAEVTLLAKPAPSL